MFVSWVKLFLNRKKMPNAGYCFGKYRQKYCTFSNWYDDYHKSGKTSCLSQKPPVCSYQGQRKGFAYLLHISIFETTKYLKEKEINACFNLSHPVHQRLINSRMEFIVQDWRD